jgi:hypothetical protein
LAVRDLSFNTFAAILQILHVVRTGKKKNAYKVFVGKPEGKRPPGKPRLRLEDSIKMDLREVG